MKRLIFSVLALVLSVSLLPSTPIAASSIATKLPTKNTPASQFQIKYDDLSYVLQNSVLETGRSDRRVASRAANKNTSTKIKHGNSKATALEGNRVLFHEFTDNHRALLLAIRQDLEAVPNHMPLEKFSKNEQLAYWFNLHNVAVMLAISENYPVKSIKRISKGKKDVWAKKTMSIGGVPTSIRDIEEHVISNWNSPLVLYGFYMGAIGGPNIRTEAYTGKDLNKQLEANAFDFINSLRGIKLWSGKGRVSDHYKMGKDKYFPDFDKNIKHHLLTYARGATRRSIVGLKKFQIKNYDWSIADLKNGESYSGSSYNTNPGALTHFIETPNPNLDNPFGGAAPANLQVTDSFASDPAVVNMQIGTIAPHVTALLNGLKKRDARRRQQGTVSVEEFVNEEGSRIGRK